MKRSTEHRAEIIDKIIKLIEKKLTKAEASVASAFVQQYYGSISWDDLQSRSINDLYGAVLAHWKLLAKQESSEPIVQVYNPNQEQHGWQSPHTVVAIVIENMPFLVDSVRMAINEHQFTTHFIVHFALKVIRTRGCVAEVLAQNTENEKADSRAVLYFEVDRQTDAEVIEGLREQIRCVLDDVTDSVQDWQAMLNQSTTLTAQMDLCKKRWDADIVDETKAFLEWVNGNNFTFLGCQDYELVKDGDKHSFRLVPQSGLGLLREDRPGRSLIGTELIAERRSDWRVTQDLLVISKSNVKSSVHRPAYMDYFAVKRVNESGDVIGERRFVGLYTSTAYNSSPTTIPIVRSKVKNILQRSGLPPKGHSGKELLNILETYPRDELFQASEEELCQIAFGILHLQERKGIKCFLRKDVFGRFVTCLVFVPRERYSTELRQTFEQIFKSHFNSREVDFTTSLSEAVLARTLYVVHVSPDQPIVIDEEEIQEKLVEASRTWSDDLRDALIETQGEEKGVPFFNLYAQAFPIAYQESYDPRTAVYDIRRMESLESESDVGMSFYRPLELPEGQFRFKIFQRGGYIPLSDVLPMLENMGLRVLGEHPYKINLKEKTIWLHDFTLFHEKQLHIVPDEVRDIFQEAFAKIWFGNAENDGFNRLVLNAGLSWRETALIRAYAKYLRQIGFTFSQAYVEETLSNNPHIVKMLIKRFYATFHTDKQTRSLLKADEIEHDFFKALDLVSNLDEDRILRRYLDIIKATLRTNFLQKASKDDFKDYISIKFDPEKIPDMPLPRPQYEIFVYSPRVEGVHLRGGKVARGGIRWSDRREDFRTEVLGLVKAQQVKNAVIVPVGAKGGFVPKCIPSNGTRDEIMTEVVECYSTFIRGLLDITDNLRAGKVVAPKQVIRLDEDDPYLVVAADKGTATFSDIANQIAQEYDFWLGDAFASGGSVGYDHKKMGITARGAWESVKRHFREMDVDCQNQDFTVVGIGDMSGDVFGNGMLLSKHIRLQAAFNHMHIFIDPNPDPSTSYKERERLFKLNRSTWEDYNQTLISKGGGVFRRSAKSILLTPEIKSFLGLRVDVIEPSLLVQSILKAKVDLLWNGGIGTYVKAKSETNDQVGDRANDVLRINGEDLGCNVIGEGGNLGLTQLGRIEAALKGVKVNTDFIDNSGGVDCSDHEVNIKILLNAIVSDGDMTRKQRNELLAQMTEATAALVLHNNYRQTQALSIANYRSHIRLEDHMRLIHELERLGKLDRALEGLPSDDEIKDRKLKGHALTAPELSVLIAYTKNVLQAELIDSDVPDDEYFIGALKTAFPEILGEQYQREMKSHRLRREIIATQLANTMINKMGASFVLRLRNETGASAHAIVRSFTVARAIFDMEALWQAIESLDTKVSAKVQIKMMLETMRLVRRATRWLLRNYRRGLEISKTIDYFAPRIKELSQTLSKTLSDEDLDIVNHDIEDLARQNVPEKLARRIACLKMLFPAMDIIEAARQSNGSVKDLAALYFSLGHTLNMQWLRDQIAELVPTSHWENLAIAAFRDDFDYQQSALTLEISNQTKKNRLPAERVEQWMSEHRDFIEQWNAMISESSTHPTKEFAMFAVAIRELSDLVHMSRNEQKPEQEATSSSGLMVVK